MDKKKLVKWIIFAAIPIIAALIFFIFENNRAFVSAVVNGFSTPLRNFLGTVNSIFPFSVMELLYAAAIILLIIFIVRTVVKTVKSDKRLVCIAKRVIILVIVALYIFSGYLWLWGIDYRGTSFARQAGLDVKGVSTEELYAVALYFVENAVRLSDTVPRDEEGHFFAEPSDYLPNSVSVYNAIQEEFPFLEGTCRMPKKMLFSKLMSYMNFTGVYFPFTGESNLNVDCPACFIPSTAAHELAHQLGVTSEQECNFLSIAACISSDDPIYVYSGYLSGATHLLNALYDADYDLWHELRYSITGNMQTDLSDNNAYWRDFKTPVSEVSEKVYDSYLKANGDPLGIQSYGACVDLLVTYYGSKI